MAPDVCCVVSDVYGPDVATPQGALMIRPIGHRVVVIPDAPATETESGIFIPEQYQDTPPMSGIVQTLGDGPVRDQRIRTRTIAHCLSILDDAQREAATSCEALTLAREEMGRYLVAQADATHVCHVGQRVIFPMEAGHEIIVGESADPMVVLSEDAILAVYEGAAV